MLRLAPGSVIANTFEIVRSLGSGAMGTVFEAKVTENGRRVALKFPHPSFAADKSAAQRFLREAQATISIRSPHVVRTYAVVKMRRGMPVIVMEYVEGIELHDLIEDYGGPIPMKAALGLVDQIAIGLAAAHDAGVVHRDLKPGNVLIKNPDSAPLAKVFDFGLSVILSEGTNRLTFSGASFGTPQYMAPEQIRDTKHVDGRADIYALGVITYEMLTGRWPFTGATVQDIWHDVLNCEPWPLRDRRPNLPEELYDFVAKAMARDPDQRYSDAHELRAALAALR